MKRLVITGMGAVTPIGHDVPTYWENLNKGCCGIADITRIDVSNMPVKRAAEVTDFSARDYMPAKLTRDLDVFMQYAYAAAEEALSQSGLKDADPYRTGIVMGSALSGLSLIGNTQEALMVNGKAVGPKFLSKVMGNIAAAQFAIWHGIKGPSLTVSTACSSGGDALATAAMLLETDAADAMVVMAGESAISPLLIQSLSLGGALSRSGESRPFDTGRNGFVIGEGGGALIVETEEHAKARGAVILAELAGYANNTDAYNTVAPDPEGAGAAACMKLALKKANLSPQDIGYINAHGTATHKGDIAESKAIGSVFGSYRVPVSSTKGATGHMMGAGGLTECIACIKAIETGMLPPTISCDEVDPACDIDVVTKTPMKKTIKAAMSNALGFGGQNSSIIVKEYEG